jgi:adenosylmethionine-8-amino-7-oxononanoate aminotransferase
VIGEIRGKGLLLGVEFVKDRKTKEQFKNKFGTQVGETALKEGLLLRYNPNWIAFGPPLIIKEDELDTMIRIFRMSLEKTMEQTKE